MQIKYLYPPSVLEEMKLLRFEAQLEICIERLDLHSLSTTKIVFYNIRSLYRHVVDLAKDFSLMSADILAISESRLMASDGDELYKLPNFTTHRFDYQTNNAQRPVYGLVLYVKDHVTVRNYRRVHVEDVQFFLLNVASSLRWLTLVFTHLPPKTSSTKTKRLLRDVLGDISQPFLSGDFNDDSRASDSLKMYISAEFGLRYLETGSTSDYGFILDHAYTNVAQDKIHFFWGGGIGIILL